MPVRRLAVLGLLASVLLAPAVRAEEDPLQALERRQQEIFERVGPAVAFVSTEDGFGSGFFVNPAGLLLTNDHVVRKAQTVQVVLWDGRQLRGQVVERAAGDIDLALVQVPVSGVRWLPLHPESDLRIGAWVAAVGHGAGAIWTFTTGMVSNIYPLGADRPVFQTQIPLNRGNSGGPVVDRLGRVVGVVTAAKTDAPSINFAIHSDVALRSLRRLADVGPCLTIRAPAGVPVFLDGAMKGMGPRLVVLAVPGTHEVFAVIGGRMSKATVHFPDTRLVELK